MVPGNSAYWFSAKGNDAVARIMEKFEEFMPEIKRNQVSVWMYLKKKFAACLYYLKHVMYARFFLLKMLSDVKWLVVGLWGG